MLRNRVRELRARHEFSQTELANVLALPDRQLVLSKKETFLLRLHYHYVSLSICRSILVNYFG